MGRVHHKPKLMVPALLWNMSSCAILDCMTDNQLTETGALDGGNLDLDFIDYPTAWAIQRKGLTHADEQCSAVRTGGAMLCDCNAMPSEWARLKTAHDGSDGRALAARYMSTPPGGES